MADIVIKASPNKPVLVDLVGIEYKVKPPKMSLLAVVAKAAAAQGKENEGGTKVIEHVENLVKLMFGASAAKVLARLEDAADDLDYQQIMDTAEAVIEASGNPTS